MPTNPLLTLTAKQLRRAVRVRERIDGLEKKLDLILGVQSPGKSDSSPARSRRKRRLSVGARARLSAAAKARWKKVKARGGKSL